MAALFTVTGLLLVILCAIVVVLLVQLLGRAAVAAEGWEPGTRSGLRRVQRTLASCLGAATLVLVGGVALSSLVPSWLGLPLAVAPGLAASLALLGFAGWPTTRPQDGAGPTSASLTPREAWTFGSRWSFVGPALLAAVFLVLLAVAAGLASPDSAGRMRAFTLTQGDMESTASPFPGSFYGVPLAVVTVLLMVSTYAALRRMATSAVIVPSGPGRPGDPSGAAAIDRRWREITTRVVLRISTAALLGQAAGCLVFAGSAMHHASDFVENGGLPSPWSAAGLVVTIVGQVSLLVAAVLAGAAVAAVLSLRDQAVRPPRLPAGHGS